MNEKNEFDLPSPGCLKNLMDSKTSLLDDLLSEKLEQAFHHPTSKYYLHEVARIALEHAPIDLAYAANRLPPNDRHVLFENLKNEEDKIIFLTNADCNTRSAIFRHISDTQSKELIEKMAPDEAISVLEDLSERRFRKIIELLPSKKALVIKELKKHAKHSAGRLMSNEFFSFPLTMTIDKAAATIRDNPGIDLTRTIFVLDARGILKGYVPSRNMIVNPPSLELQHVMRPILHKVGPDATREEVVDLVERYKISALPVVDISDHLLGVITFEDVIEVMEDIADETIAQMAGTIEKVSEHVPVYKRLFARAPWLFVTLMAGLINVMVMSNFEKEEGKILTFALFFVPLITGMSGNIGIQSSTILVRGMATGIFTTRSRREVVLKEIFIGITSGVFFGILSGIFVFLLNHFGLAHFNANPYVVGLIVGVGLLGGCIAGTFLGVFSPLFFARLGIDPAIASGPIITAFNDFFSMTIYFLIAIGIGSFFL